MAPFPPAQSGVIWTRSVGEEIRTSVAVSANRAVVTTDQGTLLALRMSNGDEIWRTSLEEEPTAAGSPIIINNTIFVGTEQGNLHAHDVRDGSRLWTLPLDSAVLGSTAFADGSLYTVTRAGVLYAVD
jgi:outer membrane protein assembly factor BamB